MSLPPIAKQVPHQLTKHGHHRNDPYFWLNKREDPEVIDYLNAENAYTKQELSSTERLQEDLYKEIIGRIKEDDSSVPYFSNGYFYYSRFEQDKEYPIYCRKLKDLDKPEEVILDVNQLAEGKNYCQVGSLSISPNNNIIAYSVDDVSRRIYKIYFKDLSTGKIWDEVLDGTSGGGAWANDNQHYFYTVKDSETLRSHQIKRHQLNTNQDQDVVVFEEKDETFGCYVSRSKSRAYLFIGSYQTLSTEYRYLNADNPLEDFRIISRRQRDHEYSVAHYGDHFYIVTNWKAKNFRLMKCHVNHTAKSKWREVIPHRPDVMVEDLEIFENHMVIQERSDGLTQIQIIDNQTKEKHYLNFGEEAYTAYISTNPDFNTSVLRFAYTSMTTPNSTYDYDMVERKSVLLKEAEVVGDFDKNNYQTKRHYATSRDGKKIPISLVYKKGLKLDGKNPLVLYAYGSYGSTIDPYFSAVRLSLLDRGFVWAIAHIRGGEIYGRPWYEDGKLLKKKNTFYDFIDAAEFLITEKYCTNQSLYAMGGSAGGLLMGAVINLRPDLWKGVIAAVPFVDVVTTMLDDSIPLTTGEYDEWGNPNDKIYYDYILSYSPYDNIEKKEYPNLLVTTGLHDSQVQYWEPAKWVAKLRENKTDKNLLLLHTNMEAGHGGASGRYTRHKETAMEYAFFLLLTKKNQ